MRKVFPIISAAALLYVILLSGCANEDKTVEPKPILPSSRVTATEDANKEKTVIFEEGKYFSGDARPVVVTDDGRQHLSEDPVGEAVSGRMIYTVNSDDAGFIDGVASQPAGKESRAVEAIPKLGYKFVKWSDGVTDKLRKGDTAEGVYTAVFDYAVLDMPVIVINTDSGTQVQSKTDYAGATFSLFGCDDEFVIEDERILIRGRGNNSWGYPKKSFKFKLSEKENLLGIGNGKEKIWVLIANQCDQSLQRNLVSFQMGRYFRGIDWQPAATSVEVFLNGEYVGVYLLAEDIKVSKNRVDITDDKVNEIDTGYLIELSHYAVGDVINVANRPYMIHSELSENKEVRSKQKEFIREYMQDAYNALLSGDRDEAEKYIDIDSLLATYLTEEVMKNLDSQWDSFYLWKDTGTKLFFGPMWDFDLALGNANEGEEVYYDIFVGNGRGSAGSLNTWFAVANMQEWFRQAVQDKWNEIKDSISVMPDYIRAEGAAGLRSYNRNFMKWKIFGTTQNRETEAIRKLRNYTEHYEYLADWLTQRIEWLDGVWSTEEFVKEGRELVFGTSKISPEGDFTKKYGNKAAEELSEKYSSMTEYINQSSVKGADGYPGEGVGNLFDDNKDTKYCLDMPEGEITVTFELKAKKQFKAYLFRTANDTQNNATRNPDAWTIYGSADGKTWNEMASVSNGEKQMDPINKSWFGFEIENQGAYKYYKIVFKNEGIMQLSEIRFLG